MKITNEHVELILKEAKYKSGSSSRLQKAQKSLQENAMEHVVRLAAMDSMSTLSK